MSDDLPSDSVDGLEQHRHSPLDLLLNVMSGGGQYAQDDQTLGGLLDPILTENDIQEDGVEDGSNLNKRSRVSDSSSPRPNKMNKTVASTQVKTTSPSRIPDITAILENKESSFSNIEVWYPSTGQKSYGKERRMLNPPPVLRVTGPLSQQLTTVSLHSVTSPNIRPDQQGQESISMSSQTHNIPLEQTPMQIPHEPFNFKSRRTIKMEERLKIQSSAIKNGFAAALPHLRSQTVNKEREALVDGLSFPGLWVGDEVGKGKSFKLELRLGTPGNEVGTEEPEATEAVVVPQEAVVSTGTPSLSAIPTLTTEPADLNTTLHTVETTLNTTITIPAAKVPAPTWATLHTTPLTIVSKPSQKTAKARSMNTCLTELSSVALWVRINSQTVRTKYMKVSPSASQTDTHDLTAKTGKWTPFRFEVLEKAILPVAPRVRRGRDADDDEDSGSVNSIITYGSVVILVDLQSGVRSEKVRLVRVEKNEVIIGEDWGHPVSDLQRVGFARVAEGEEEVGGRWYLSAPGARSGGGEMLPPSTAPPRKRKATQPEPESDPMDGMDGLLFDGEVTGEASVVKPRKRKTKRNALAIAVLAEDDQGGANSILSWARAEKEEKEVVDDEKLKTKRMAEVEKVEDWMCWVVGGVSCLSHTLFDAFAEPALAPTVPSDSIDPIPQVIAPPKLEQSLNTLEITLSTNLDQKSEPLDLYLGPIGPVQYTTWRSTCPSTSMSEIHARSQYPAVLQSDEGASSTTSRVVTSNFPSSIPHVLVVIDLPGVKEIVGAMRRMTSAARGNESKAPVEDAQPQVLQTGITTTTELALASIPYGAGPTAETAEGTELIDPELAALSVPQTLGELDEKDDEKEEELPDILGGDLTDNLTTSVHLDAAKVGTTPTHLASLPLFLVRRSDGLGFEAGCAVKAKFLGEGDGELDDSHGEWQLEVVPDGAGRGVYELSGGKRWTWGGHSAS